MNAGNNTEGGNVSHIKTETSPLKDNVKNKYICFDYLFCNCKSDNGDHSGSLRTIVVILFGATGAITLALLTQIYYGEYQITPHGSVTSDDIECSNIGVDILKKGGNAIDAAIATTVCLGVVNFHVTGLGGGGYLLLYNHQKHKIIDAIDFREMVPKSYNLKEINTSVNGLMVGVPGFVKGLWDSHNKHGKLPWNDLIIPSLKLARDGFRITDNVISAAAYLNSNGYNSNLVKFMNSLEQGQLITMPELATTLELIALKGAEGFYNGSLAMDIVYSVKLADGNMSLNDLSEYKVSQSNILKTRISDFDIFVPGSSSGGALLLNSLDSIEILDLSYETDTPSEIILKISDILHDAYLSFLQKSEASSQQPEPAASQVSAVDSDENYVTIISGLNTWLGSQLMTNNGFILNNAISRGGINENRRPISLASPIIVVQYNEVCGKRFILGSSDVIIAAQFLSNLLIFNKSTLSSIESPRFNIDNRPRHIRLEENHKPSFSSESIEKLKPLISIENLPPPYKSINVIEKVVDSIYSYADSRGGGKGVQF